MHFFVFLYLVFNPLIRLEGEPMNFSQIENKTQIELPQGGSIFSENFLINIGYLSSQYDSKGEISGEGSGGVFFSNGSSSLSGENLFFDNHILSILGNVEALFEDVVELESDSAVLSIEKNNFVFERIERNPKFFYKNFSLSANLINFDILESSFSGKEDVFFEFYSDLDAFNGNANFFHGSIKDNLIYFSNIFLSNDKGYDIESEYVEINTETIQFKFDGKFELTIRND